MLELVLIVVALLLVAACGAFVAAEFALITVDRGAAERAADGGDRQAKGVLTALRSLSTQLSGAQVGITLTNLLIGFLAEPSIADLIRGPLADIGVPDGAVSTLALVIALTLATTVTMVFGELVPKNLAIAKPMETARAVQRFQRRFTALAGPVITFFNNTANALLRRVGIEPQEELASARSAEELSSLVRRSAEQGTLGSGTANLLERSLHFGERQAVDVMTPRERMTTLRPDDQVLDILLCARETGRSRFPVIDLETDQIAGVVHIKDAMGIPYGERASTSVAGIVQPPVLVPTTLALDDLLAQLRRGGLQLALVINEFGGVDGLVTLEDLLEEIVGEVLDEHDPEDETVLRLDDHSWEVSGLLRPDEVQDRTGIGLPDDEDYETVGGLVAKHLERLPAVGDTLELVVPEPATDSAPATERRVRLEVRAMDGLRVDRLLVAEVRR